MSQPSFKLARFVVVAVGAAAFAASCSHQQKVDPPAPVVAQAAPELGRSRSAPAPARPTPVVAAKESEDRAIFFDFGSALLRDDARPVLQKVASELHGTDKEAVEVDGNCDELGTTEYNLALGDHRARAAKEYLVHLGVPSGRIKTVSYGSQRPKFPGHDDDSRAKNRRDDFVMR
jgi:peptidoglycan-associated lipoprotein